MRNLPLILVVCVALAGCGNAALEKAQAEHAQETAKLTALREQYTELMVPYDGIALEMGEARARNNVAAIVAANEKLEAINKSRKELEEKINTQQALVDAATAKVQAAK